jgi:hypothetical protein
MAECESVLVTKIDFGNAIQTLTVASKVIRFFKHCH